MLIYREVISDVFENKFRYYVKASFSLIPLAMMIVRTGMYLIVVGNCINMEFLK